MKQISFNQEQLKPFGDSATLSNFIEKLEGELDQEGQVLCKVKVDGMDLSEEDESRLGSIQLSTVENIEVAIENGADICSRVLKGWLETIPWLQEQSNGLADRLRYEGVEGQLKGFAELVESCGYLVESLVSIRQQMQSSIDEKAWKEAEANFRSVVNEVLGAFKKKDFVLLADLLEYDFCTVLTAWHRLMAKVDLALGEKEIDC